MLRLRDELELKVDVLSLPVDICVQHALQGNSALQGALNVALRVLQDIEDYEANLRQQEIDMVSCSHVHDRQNPAFDMNHSVCIQMVYVNPSSIGGSSLPSRHSTSF